MTVKEANSKIARVITSCKTMEQLKVAENITRLFYKKYGMGYELFGLLSTIEDVIELNNLYSRG